MQARRVVAMAASHDLYVVPHGSSVYSYHLQYAFPNCPLAEFINLSPQVGVWLCIRGHKTSNCVYSSVGWTPPSPGRGDCALFWRSVL